jgi:dipeptidyl aminopeptidase/acylaminoacyl peptidase
MSGPPGCATPLLFDREKIAAVRRDYEDPAKGRPVADFTLDTIADEAAYSRQLDRILTVDNDAEDTVLHVVDPAGKTETKLPIPNYARALALSPDGARALVASVKALVVVDIDGARIEKTLPFATDTRAATFLTNTRVAVLDAGPNYESREGAVHLIDIETGNDVTTAEILDDYARLNLHPDGKTIYAFTDRGGYRLARFDVGRGSFSFVRASAAEAGRGSFLVYQRDGKAAVDFAGRLFTLSDAVETDMTVAKDLKLPSRHMDGSPVADELVRVPDDPPQADLGLPSPPPEIRDITSGALLETLSLPGLLAPGVYRDSEPTHAFYSADGKWIHVIARANDAPDSLSRKRAFLKIAR